jgi:hypothetical protein
MSADLSGLDLVALLIDGGHFGEHTCVVALGIGVDGTKHPWPGGGRHRERHLGPRATVGLRERGLDPTRPILCVLDGAKALRRAVLEVVDHPVLASCQQHKLRNVRDKLPSGWAARSSVACGSPTMPPLPGTPRRSLRRWPESSTRPTREPRPACVRPG